MRRLVKYYVTFPLWIAVYLSAAAWIGQITRAEISGWYAYLEKPFLNPPDFIFGIVWTILYILIAIAGWRLSKTRRSPEGKINLVIFAIQTFINWAWSFLFFSHHLLGFSFIWILVLILFVAALIFRSDRITAAILLPYLGWIVFAAYLNGMIWHLN